MVRKLGGKRGREVRKKSQNTQKTEVAINSKNYEGGGGFGRKKNRQIGGRRKIHKKTKNRRKQRGGGGSEIRKILGKWKSQ